MINKKVVIGVLLAMILVFTGCSSGIPGTLPEDTKSGENETNETAEPTQGDVQESGQKPTKAIDTVEEQINNMTLDEKLGQMIIAGFDGHIINDYALSMIINYHIGGFILFSRNVESSNQLLALVNSLKSENSNNKVPLFVSVDEEGGRISRMPEELEKLPGSQAIGKINNSGLSYEIGNILAEEVKLFGFNVDFAPVLDINSNPKNTVIGDRAYGSGAEVVSRLGVQTMRGLQEGGVIPVVKHFPGHGDTSVDSHIGLPSVDNDIDRLESFELVPFDDAINNNADAVMIAHILLSKIDPEYPASMSKTIITDLLRNQMDFNGVVITDDMTMGAIVNNYGIGDAAVRSIEAGSDIILVCHGYENGLAVINALNRAVMDGTITEDRVDESVYRILKLKSKYNLSDNVLDSVDVEKINGKINSLKVAFSIHLERLP